MIVKVSFSKSLNVVDVDIKFWWAFIKPLSARFAKIPYLAFTKQD